MFERTRRSPRDIEGHFSAVANHYDELPIGANRASEIFVCRMPVGRGRVLDVGCGTGTTLIALSKFFDELHGVDISHGMLAVASRKLRAEGDALILLSEADASKLSYEEECFDYVVSNTMLHHIEDWGAALAQMKRVLRHGGRLVVVDILRARLSGCAPVLSWYILIALQFIKMLVTEGPSLALRAWICGTDPAWIEHQSGEVFLDEAELRMWVEKELPDAIFQGFNGEMGLTRFCIIQWNKP